MPGITGHCNVMIMFYLRVHLGTIFKVPYVFSPSSGLPHGHPHSHHHTHHHSHHHLSVSGGGGGSDGSPPPHHVQPSSSPLPMRIKSEPISPPRDVGGLVSTASSSGMGGGGGLGHLPRPSSTGHLTPTPGECA
jgi:MADS-box transcription enhancer factor 2